MAGAIKRDAEKMLEKVGSEDQAVAYGRADDEAGDTLYVGLHAITSDERDVLVVSWQSDVADPFYKATANNPLGLTRKRTFSCNKNTIDSFDDIVFADLAERIKDLTEPEQIGLDDALLRDLQVGREGQMQEIARTIQAAQHELITHPLERLLMIQGGPGTAKPQWPCTACRICCFTIATRFERTSRSRAEPDLHLLHQERLPKPGDDGVEHRDLRRLGPITSGGLSEPLESHVARVKAEWRVSTNRATSRVRFPVPETSCQSESVVLVRAPPRMRSSPSRTVARR